MATAIAIAAGLAGFIVGDALATRRRDPGGVPLVVTLRSDRDRPDQYSWRARDTDGKLVAMPPINRRFPTKAAARREARRVLGNRFNVIVEGE